MAINKTTLMKEVDTIVERGQSLTHFQLDCRILANNQWLQPLKMTNMSIERDYENNYGDATLIDCLMGGGDYAYQLFPYRDDLWVEITTTPLYENSDRIRRDAPRQTHRYRAILVNQDNPGLVGRHPQSDDQEDLNRTEFITVTLQMVGEGLNQIRMMSVGRLYRKMAPADALLSVLTETTSLVNARNQQQVLGVTRVDGYNTDVRQTITIPHGTPLVDTGPLLQKQEGGVYSAGLGMYLQDRYWHVFPLYDTTRFQKTSRTLTVVSVPPNRYLGAERTYHTKGDQVTVISAGNQSSQDPGLYHQLNQGNAVRFGDTRKLLGHFDQTRDNHTTLSRRENLFEFQGPRLQQGLTNARWADQRSTSNPFPHYSEIARRDGRTVVVQWLHGDASLLYPGMPVRFMTVINDRVRVFKGVLLGVMENRIPREGGAVARQFPAALDLKVFLTRQDSP